ncbi:MAG: hypothetical protein EG824_00145 [Deltaproteobacteria bacterium]|nr:hypothetical protein [Deltaproteobacteria bacterium]
MKLELQSSLFQSYPNFFRRPRRVHGNNVNMELVGPLDYWGIECGDGWYPLVDGLSRQFEAHISQLILQKVSKRYWPRAQQIKEKFGGLAISIRRAKPLPEELMQAMAQAEAASWTICEACGQPGILRREGYLSVLCDVCFALPAQDDGFDFAGYRNQIQALLDCRSM